MKPYNVKFLSLLLALFFISLQTAFANSGPTFWQGYPSSEVLAVDDNCPIEIEQEKLSFDLSGNSSHDYTIWGQVRASYNMLNPSDQDLSLQMAFPFVSSIKDFSPKDVLITVDGTTLPYDLYIGDVVENYGNPGQQKSKTSLAFEDILSTISKPEHYSEYEKGNLYTIKVKPTPGQRINFVVDFEFDKDKTKVLTNGFNRYERDGNHARIAAWCYEPQSLEIFVLEDDIDFNVTAYTDGELKQETDAFKYEITTKEKELKSYIMDCVNEFEKIIEGQSESADNKAFVINEAQLYSLYRSALERAFTINEGFATGSELTEQNFYERVLTLVYTVAFPASSGRDVTVSYKTSGTMNKTKTKKPLYTFDYILNPAKNWSSFKDLEIEIITPEEAPHIIESSIEFTKENDRQYRASLKSLPEEDLSFTIYQDEKISFIDKALGPFANSFGYFLPLGMFGGLIILIIAVAGRVLKR